MPRGGFTAALLEGKSDVKAEHAPLDVEERAELQWLRNRVAALSNRVVTLGNRVTTLEAQLRMRGIEPVSDADELPEGALKQGPERRMEAKLVQLLSNCGLDHYVNAFSKLGFCDLDTVRGMQETDMANLGLLPGDALKLRRKLQDHRPAWDNMPDRHLRAPSLLQHQPGIYRVVHAPRVAMRAAPSLSSKIVASLAKDDLVRIAQVLPPCWGKVDASELWARWTDVWPARPAALLSAGEDGGEPRDASGEREEDPPPDQAFILMDGAEAGISGPLLKCLPPEEAETATWLFREAQEIHCDELNAASLRKRPASSAALRGKVVETAKRYVGRPFARCYHDPSNARCQPGGELPESASFLSNVELLRRVFDDLRGDFGFGLHPNCRPADLYHMLQHDLTDIGGLEPGDLIFYETYNRRIGRSCVSHVEIFAGGSASVGSLPWSSSPRTDGKDGVQLFDNYDMEELEGLPVTNLRFCSARSLLEANACSFAHGWYVRQEATK